MEGAVNAEHRLDVLLEAVADEADVEIATLYADLAPAVLALLHSRSPDD